MKITKPYLALVVVIVIAASALVYFFQFYKSVEVGDTVTINYTAYLDTGEIFDTTLEDVAMDDTQPKIWWFTLRASYEPVKIVVGEGRMLPDVEISLIGMHEGDRKEITIPPERAAGLKDPAKIKEVPLATSLSKEEEITVEEFKQSLGQDPVADERYQMQGLSIHVIEVKDGKVRFNYELKVGQEIQISLGKAVISGETETEYQVTLTPKLGDVIFSPYLGKGVVIEVKENAMLVDFNSPLAGENIHYIIWVIKIEKP